MTDTASNPRYLIAVCALIEVRDHDRLEASVSPFLQNEDGSPEGMINWTDVERIESLLSIMVKQMVDSTTEDTGIKCWSSYAVANEVQPDGSSEGFTLPGVPPTPDVEI